MESTQVSAEPGKALTGARGLMDTEVSWWMEVAVKPGQALAFKGLMAELVDSASAEPGTLSCEWSIDDHDEVAHIYERYSSSEAALAHLLGFRERYGRRFLAASDRTAFVVHGNPGDDLKAALEGSGAVYMGAFVGFDR